MMSDEESARRMERGLCIPSQYSRRSQLPFPPAPTPTV